MLHSRVPEKNLKTGVDYEKLPERGREKERIEKKKNERRGERVRKGRKERQRGLVPWVTYLLAH